MRKLFLSLLAVTLLLGAAACGAAEGELKPLLTVSFSGYDKLLANLDLIGRLGGSPDTGKSLDMMLKIMTQGKGLAGLDTKQPWGAVLLNDGKQQFVVCGFLPATDLKQLIELAKNTRRAEITQTGDVYEIKAGPTPIYAIQRGKWAILSNKTEDLAKAPEDPLHLLGDLPKRYDLAIRASVKNLPKELRDQALAQIRAGTEAGMQQLPGESEQDYQVRLNMSKQAIQQMTKFINELEDLLVGWTVDASTNTTYLDVELIGQKGTKLASQLERLKDSRTQFAGLQIAGAAVVGASARTLNDEDVAQMKTTLADLKKKMIQELDKQDLEAEQMRLAKQFVNDVLEASERTAEAKTLDAGLVVTLDPSAVSIVGASALADGAKLDAAFRRLVEGLKKSDPDAAQAIKLDVGTVGDVKLHMLSFPTPDAKLVPMVGETLDVVIGIGSDKVLFSAGRDAIKTLKKVLDQSKSAGSKEIPPMHLSVSVRQIAKFAANVGENDEARAKAAMVAGMLEKAGDKDHVTLTAKSIPDGLRIRLELEEGLLKVLGSLGQMMGPQSGGGMPPAGPGGNM